MEFPKAWACSALTISLFSFIAGCQSAPTPQGNSPAPKIVLQPEHTEPVANAPDEDCGFTDSPVSRSNREILAHVPHNDKQPPNSDMLAKIAIDKDGKIAHLQVLSLAHSNAPNWKEINETALADIKKMRYKPAIYQGKSVADCSDVSVTIDLY